MAANTANPYGCVQLADGGTPRVITVRAVTNISGGYWVVGSGVAGAATVGSGADSFGAGDILGYANTAAVTGSNCFGIALTNIASGADGLVAMRGIFIMPAGSGTTISSVSAGCPIAPYDVGAVIGSSTLSCNCYVGRALTSAGGGDSSFSIISLNA